MTLSWRQVLAAVCFGLTFPYSAPALTADEQRTGVSESEIVLGSCAPLTGQQKVRGVPVVQGGDAYFKYINEQGGINGRMIKLVSCDDHYNVNDGAITCFDNCLKNKVFLGTLFQGTSSATRYVTMGDINRIPLVGFSTGGNFIVQPVHHYIFQVRAGYDNEARAQIDTLWNKLGIHRIALLYQDDAYGTTCRNDIIAALSKQGGRLIAEASYPRLGTDIDPLVNTVKQSNPGAIIIAGAGKAVSLIVKAKDRFGKHVQMVTFSSSSDLLTEEAGTAADGTLLSEVLPLADKNLPAVQLYTKLMAKYFHAAPTYSGFEGFLIGMVVVKGLQAAGKDLTRDGFIKSMESIHNLDIGLGKAFTVSFSPDDHDGMHGHVRMAQIKNGHIEPVTNWDSFKQAMMAQR